MLQFDLKDISTLNKYPPGAGRTWEESIYNRIKGNIKKYYCIQQRRLCVYCRTELTSACHSEHIEHVVNKDLKPQWMFEPLNLGLSCSQCNTKKGTYNTLRSHLHIHNLAVLPQGSYHYRIVHPHFDNYDLHIEIEDDFYVKARTRDKGQQTIDMCHLWRPLYADRRARAIGLSQAGRHTAWLFRVQKPGVSQQEKDAFLEEIDDLAAILIV